MLLQHGANIAIEDADGWSAHKVAREKGNIRIAELLNARTN